jgi:hypothetical protein
MGEEYDALVANDTWTLVDRPPGPVRVLGGKWVLKHKPDGRYKARWVAWGNQQRPGIDYNEVFAAVAKSMTVRVLLALVGMYDLYAEQLDVLNAFLNGDLSETIYMDLPTGYRQEGKVCLLRKTLYGLCQSAREWYQAVAKQLTKQGFIRCESDHSLFTKDGVIIVVYVDDILLISKDKNALKKVKEDLIKVYAMRDLGPVNTYLGIQVTRDRTKGTLKTSQSAYTQKLIATHFGSSCGKASTPMDPKANLVTPEGHQATAEAIRNYQAMVGGLLYLSVSTRPDIAFAVGKMARFATNPTSDHYTAVKRIFRYLQGTTTYAIEYNKNGGGLTGYTDANWAGGSTSEDGRRSTSGYVFTLGGAPVSWSSKRQHSVALSSCEAEYIGQCNAAREAVFLRLLLKEVGYPIQGPTEIYADNQSAIALAKNPVYHARSRHIDIQYHFVREKVADGTVEYTYLPTNDMVADGLTKPLERVKHGRFVSLLEIQDTGGK